MWVRHHFDDALKALQPIEPFPFTLQACLERAVNSIFKGIAENNSRHACQVKGSIPQENK